MKGHSGANLLHQRIAEIAARHAGGVRRAADVLDWGTILADGSLLVDSFDVPFPLGEYYRDDLLVLDDPITATSQTVAGGTLHSHDVPRPPVLAKLQPGDRVRVEWLSGHADPCVVGRPRRTHAGDFG